MAEFNPRKYSGQFTEMDWAGKLADGATVTCCHCQQAWVVRKGSGKLRGFCDKCMGYICGPACLECIPSLRRIENIEAGRPELTPMPAMILVPREVG